jgi:hypothetical protein
MINNFGDLETAHRLLSLERQLPQLFAHLMKDR